MMQALDKDLRSALEKTVKAARTVAETAAQAAVEQLGVGHDKPEAFLSDDEKALRNRLRTHGKQLGDARDSKSTNPTYGKQEVGHLVQEVAYQHWHRMLFARFLADNNLLMYDGVAVTIEECDELAPDEGAKSGWELAGKLAARMLPQVFKPGSPVFELTFAPEHQSELERLLKDLPDAVFKASDSLGWVYQFWQADNKERINKSEVKIDADELPAVTQLFTEPYMVSFLLHNSLGAWWATRHPGKPCPVNLDYFRTLEDGTPAAGKFEGWPESLADFKLLDPCCGSGHFLVAAFLMLVPMRMEAEDLSAKEAVNRVLAENIHGLELDPRCVEIAVFAVALEAWRYPDASGRPIGVREIPAPNIACCGLKVAAKAQDWEALVPVETPNAIHLREGLTRLHRLFVGAPVLGSLLSPSKQQSDLFGADYRELEVFLQDALARESTKKDSDREERWDSALSAHGLLEAARLLSNTYHLVVTNVPFLTGIKFSDSLKTFIESHYEIGKANLATAMAIRLIELLRSEGVAAYVAPQSWMFLKGYSNFRAYLMREHSIRLVARLGEKGFQSAQANGEQVSLNIIEAAKNKKDYFSAFDASAGANPEEKALLLKSDAPNQILISEQLRRLQHVIIFSSHKTLPSLSTYATAFFGSSAGDRPRFVRNFWEVNATDHRFWEYLQSSPSGTTHYSGLSECVLWEEESGQMRDLADSVKHLNHKAQQWRSGKPNWGKNGLVTSLMAPFPTSIYMGQIYDTNCSAIVSNEGANFEPLVTFGQSSHFSDTIKSINQNRKVEVKTVLSVPYDAEFWKNEANERYPNGLPKPYSSDPTQWIFHGHPCGSVVWDEVKKQLTSGPLRTDRTVLQVAVARLLGYRWPAETDSNIKLSDEAKAWVIRSQRLNAHADTDGIVCIPPVGREAAAADRLLNLLADAYGAEWSNDIMAQLLGAADFAGKSLETWLRDKFFTQHCELFNQRPFVWHIWDGLRDGFAALVNYHTLDYKLLEALIYTYLGDWISRQKRDAESGVDGAQEKLAAAEALKKRLELILAGEAPYDIFVRWKSIEQQPIGWNPDLNDGVRLNIRPFVLVEDIKVKDAGVLRDRVTSRDPKTKELKLWGKDRGSDVPSAPWYELGLQYGGKVGDRINDHHLTLAEKQAARAKKGA